MKLRVTLLAAILALVLSGCAPKSRKLVLPAAPQVAAKPLPEVTIESPPEIEPVLRVDIPMTELPPEPAIEHPAVKPIPPRKPVATAPPVQAPAEPQPANPIAPPATTPRLGEIPTEERRLEAEFNGSITRARAAVNQAARHRLTATQVETVGRIRVFLQQAERSRARDLTQALELARRADLLGQDLLKSLR
jgi:hypothetical protein